MPVTTAQQWRKQSSAAIELTLPSGAIVLVRRPPLHVWIKAGKLPDSLVQAAITAQQSGAQMKALQPSQLKEMFTFIREVVVYTVVEPRIVETVENVEEEISADDVPLEDANFIFEWAMTGGAQKAKPALITGKEQAQIDLTDLRQFRTF